VPIRSPRALLVGLGVVSWVIIVATLHKLVPREFLKIVIVAKGDESCTSPGTLGMCPKIGVTKVPKEHTSLAKLEAIDKNEMVENLLNQFAGKRCQH
jgi:hypothetical protein